MIYYVLGVVVNYIVSSGYVVYFRFVPKSVVMVLLPIDL